jgi:hypothetical protein
MGCFDVYCLVCGNPCHSMLNTEYVEEIIKTKKKHYIYEAYLKNPNLIKDLNKFKKTTSWMANCTMLLTNNEIVHNCKEISCNFIFADKNRKQIYTHLIEDYNTIRPLLYENRDSGVFIHTDCYKYLKLKYNIKLNYGNLPLIDNRKNINYGDIENYWQQEFQFEDIYIDNKQYLCSSPLKNDRNISQINKNIKAMKISNKYILRPSPPISAVFYANNNIKVGNNGKLWIIKNGKWNEINKDYEVHKINIKFDFNKINNKQKTFIKKLSFISQYNNHGIFVESYTVKKTIFTIDLITIIDNKSFIEKLFK